MSAQLIMNLGKIIKPIHYYYSNTAKPEKNYHYIWDTKQLCC